MSELSPSSLFFVAVTRLGFSRTEEDKLDLLEELDEILLDKGDLARD